MHGNHHRVVSSMHVVNSFCMVFTSTPTLLLFYELYKKTSTYEGFFPFYYWMPF